ncbi:mechanosensitive ion channel protein [Helicobacter sp. 12S02634-8]|uniref:mechanosensitive ion channel family protein n=1 Tax=Helicobacter sp. 12S02634-8 TaxID=1476199 RepID=UPI000BA71FC6|nr:mechanosensitive ion channel domain-containing protein [Helicobacter sp. 12S02634-8]PAF47808.1 mechanosensitive ion channel protein [Helicobacter sp. 12S02634-8]
MDKLSNYLISALPWIERASLALLKAVIILVVGFYIAKIVRSKTHRFIGKRDEILGNFISQVAFIAVLIVTIVTMLGNIGVQTASILAVLGTAGVAIALALKDSLSSIAGGIILIVLRPFKKNDTIEIGPINGKVEAINLFNTMIRMPDDKLAVLPNRNVVNANIINCTDSEKRRIEWVFGVRYDSDIEVVRGILKTTIAQMDKIDQDMTPFVGVTDFGANAVCFTIRVWAKIQDNVFSIRSELIEATKAALDAAHIEIPPQKLDITLLNQL